jgi:predicted transcriptional regulator
MLTKDKMIETLKSLPEEKFNSIDSLIEEIILLDKIEKSLEAVEKGEILSEEEVDKEIEKW